ncbi:MAG: outer membrane protein assembly factor BamA [Candidatus Babeliaceae bacterium]
MILKSFCNFFQKVSTKCLFLLFSIFFTLQGTEINDVFIKGNNLVSTQAIKTYIPYQKGSTLTVQKTAQLLKNIYRMGYFLPTIRVEQEKISEELVNLYIIVQEKTRVTIKIEGNKHLSEKEIEKKLKISQIATLDEQELTIFAQQIKDLYSEKNYHEVAINSFFEPQENNQAIAHIVITENCPSYITRVFFEGNNNMPSKKLRNIIFTREAWLLGFFNKAGSYQPEMFEVDKHIIENFYHNNGYFTARVYDTRINRNQEAHTIEVTFLIDEGDLYTIASVHAPGNEILTEEQILSTIPIQPGMLYSKEMVRESMEGLRLLWGEFGFIYAEVHPFPQPDPENKTIKLTFDSELGNKVKVNRINIRGNKKTKESVIRREILFSEGEFITTRKMEESKQYIERLGFFDPKNGANWRVIKVDDDYADLDLLLNEKKTGKMAASIGFGGNPISSQSPSQSFRVQASMYNTNFLGRGIQYSLNGSYSFEDSSIIASVSNPWLFGRPISGGAAAFHTKSVYEDIHLVKQVPTEKRTGGQGTLGFTSPRLWYTQFLFDIGAEHITYPVKPIVSLPGNFQQFTEGYQVVLNRRFQDGTLVSVGNSCIQDFRNHPVYPSRGYIWAINGRFAVPYKQSSFGFFKVEVDAHWYTPLINEYDLVFHLRGHLGLVAQIGNHTIPYRELFNVGGPATVRGFHFGQISPQIVIEDPGSSLSTSDPIGGKKAFYITAELLFPLLEDRTIMGVVFYDGGSGWDTPNAHDIPNSLPLRNNNFSYRHAIGFGIRMTNPTPVVIDWGFKLDRNKKRGESASEMHFSASRDF